MPSCKTVTSSVRSKETYWIQWTSCTSPRPRMKFRCVCLSLCVCVCAYVLTYVYLVNDYACVL